MAYKPSKPGAQDPSKYPFTGQNYANWGEQTGFIYDPYRDAYMPDRSAAQNYYQSQGLVKPDVPGAETVKSPNGHTYSWQNGQWVDTTPKQPGLIQQATPLAAAALAVEGGKQAAQALPGLFSSGSLFSSGAAPAATSAGGTAAVGGAASGGAGLIGSGVASGSPYSLGVAAPSAAVTGEAGIAGGAASSSSAATGTGSVAGLGLLPLGAAALGTGATLAGRDWARNQGGNTETGWGLINSMNPINQFAELVGSGPKALKGDKISMGAGLALAIPTGGLSLLPALFGNKHEWKTEKNKLNKLKDKGVYIPEGLAAANLNKAQGRNAGYRQELAPDFVGRDSEGNWVNNKFAKSRNVADLHPEDIVNYAAFAEKDPDWFKKPLDQRLQVADQALRAGAVSEGKGSIKVDWKKVGDVPQSSLPQGNQGRPAQPINQGSPGMRPPNQGRPSQPMRP